MSTIVGEGSVDEPGCTSIDVNVCLAKTSEDKGMFASMTLDEDCVWSVEVGKKHTDERT